MAVATVAKEGIEKELTCPLCLDIFGEPKRLPCDHIYCKEPCLQGLLLRSQNATITCPECRTVVQVPQNNVENLPTAFRTNRLKEVYHKMQQKEETDSAAKQSEQATCTAHVSQPLAIYCETCEELLCRDCLLKSDTHKDHNHGFIEEVAEKHQQAIMTHVQFSGKLEVKLVNAIERISQERLKVSTQGKSHLDQIDASFKVIVRTLEKEKEQLKESISKKVQHKTDTLTRQEGELITCSSELSDTITRAENSAQNQSVKEVARNKKKHITKLQEVCTKVERVSLQPAEKADYGLRLTSPGEMIASYKQGNNHYPLANPQKCLVERFVSLETGKQCTAVLHVRDYAGGKCTYLQDIEVELLCIRENTVIQGRVTLSGTGNHVISFTPQSRGRHVLSVKVNNTHITGSPFSVYIQIPPQQLGWPIHTITEVYNSVGLACFKDKLYVTNFEQISVLNENTRILGTHELEGAGEITIDTETGDWFVTDVQCHQLHKFGKNGRHIQSVGSKGTGPDQFDTPNGIQISSAGEVFVCDTGNRRVKVYDKELRLQRIIGRQGKKKGFFNSPVNLFFDETGNVFVTEAANHRVQVLRPNGKTICTIGHHGSRPGELDTPVGIAISGQYTYIVDSGNKRISVFTTQGDFVTTFGSGVLCFPECIAIDRDGYVYVSDSRQKIYVF